MSGIAELVESVKRVDALLADADLEPSAERTDWASVKKKVEALRAALAEDLMPKLDGALDEVAGTEIGPKIKQRVANLHADAAVVVHLSGDAMRAAEMLARAEKLAGSAEQKAEIVAAQKEPAVYARLMHSQWLLGEGRFDEADKQAKRVRRETKQVVIAEKAKKILGGPRPLRGGPPSLFTLNGFGTGLYGSRDEDDEGRYVATLCLCALFVPVFPIAAYRVKKVDSRTYRFFAKEKLSSFARGFQALVGVAAVAAIGGAYIDSYLKSPERLAGIALEDARAIEAKGDAEATLEMYRKVVDRYDALNPSVREATAAIARVAAKAVPAPCVVDSVEPTRRAAGAYLDLPEGVRTGPAGAELTKRLEGCAAEIGDGDAAKAKATLRVLDLAVEVAGQGSELESVKQKRATARRAFAVKVAATRPLGALVELAKLTDAESVDAGRKVLAELEKAPAYPSLWAEAQADIGQWIENARGAGRRAEADAVMVKLTAALAASKVARDAIEEGDAKKIAKLAAEHPEDQELAVAVAATKRAAGDRKGARDVLEQVGPAGLMTARAQETLAAIYSDGDDLAKADEILTALVDERLPPFQDAQRAFMGKAQEVEENELSRLRTGRAPPDLEDKLRGVSDDAKQREIIRDWVADRVSGDPGLTRVRAEYLQRGAAVPASLALGTIKLRRAGDASGEARKGLLAEAERAFLAIRNEASGDPTFHLGLGQVYFRLGKNEDGEKELASVLERNVPELTLEVASTYRQLGLYARARAVATKAYETGPTPDAKHMAASLMAHMAEDLEDEEAWLRRGDTTEPTTRVGLDRVAGLKMAREGRLAEADRQFKKCVDFYDRSSKTSAAASNNAATETIRRYEVTGDPAHLRTSVSYLENASRLAPENAIILGNLVSALAHLGRVTALEKWIDTRSLALDEYNATEVIDSIADGPLEGEIIDALRKDPSFQRALELAQKQQILAPQMGMAYSVSVQWGQWSHDEALLASLHKRIEQVAQLGEANADLRAKWLAGERDEITLRARKAEVLQGRQRVARVKGGSKPTQAVAALLLAASLRNLAFFEHEAAQLDEMVSVVHEARAAWPEGITRGDASTILMTVAFFHAVEASPALKKQWDEERRARSVLSIAYRGVQGPASAEIAAALRKEPALAEAAALRKQGMRDQPTLNDFFFARIAGNAELEQAAAKVFDRHEAELIYAIYGKLVPDDEDAKQSQAVFKSRGQGL